MKGKRGQIWVETVIYTLIGLTIIGILLAVATPKINSMKDRLRINEAIDSMNKIDLKISEVQAVTGSRRVMDLKIAKGKLIFDGINERIVWEIDSAYKFSEIDDHVPIGDLDVLTEEDSGEFKVSLTKKLGIDLQVDFSDDVRELDVAPTPYKVIAENKGVQGGKIQVNLIF